MSVAMVRDRLDRLVTRAAHPLRGLASDVPSSRQGNSSKDKLKSVASRQELAGRSHDFFNSARPTAADRRRSSPTLSCCCAACGATAPLDSRVTSCTAAMATPLARNINICTSFACFTPLQLHTITLLQRDELRKGLSRDDGLLVEIVGVEVLIASTAVRARRTGDRDGVEQLIH
jgi:hypothetical protein